MFNATFRLEEYVPMALASVLGGLAFWLGWRSKRHLIKPASMNIQPDLYPQRYILQVLTLAPVTLTALMVISRRYGSLLAFARVPQQAYYVIGPEFYNVFSLLLASFVPLIALALNLALHTCGLRKAWWGFVGIALFLMFFLIALKLGARYRLLLAIIPAFAVYLSTRQRRIGLRSLIIMGSLGVLFYILGRIRYQLILTPRDILQRTIEYFTNLRHGLYFDIFMAGDFDAFENGMHLLYLVPHSRPFMLGSTLISVLYNPIPRAIWPGKPAPSINQYLIEIGMGPASVGHFNFAVSLIAELYVNFWWIGVAVGMFLLGNIAARLWNWFLANRHRPEAWFHIGLFCAYLPMVTRGSFHSMTVYYLMVVVNEILSRKVAGLLAVMGRREKRSRALSSLTEVSDTNPNHFE